MAASFRMSLIQREKVGCDLLAYPKKLVTFKSVYMGSERDLRQFCTSDRAGAFSGVTGGRALSFHGLSMGETPGP